MTTPLFAVVRRKASLSEGTNAGMTHNNKQQYIAKSIAYLGPDGAAEGDRTLDLSLTKDALYH
jgi:hypothetical protein